MIRGIINYLALRYPEYGFKKQPVEFGHLLDVLEREGVEIVAIDEDRMKYDVSSDYVDTFSAYLTNVKIEHGHDVNESIPVLFYKSSLKLNKKWFAVAHEMGHFFLHKFFYNREDPIDEEKEGVKGWKGRLESEADLFANYIFLPDKLIEKKFGCQVREIILKKEGPHDLKKIYEKIFKFCMEHCDSGLGLAEKDIHQRAILNLKFRANRYISGLREELFLINHNENCPSSLVLTKEFDKKYKKDPWEKYLNMKFKRGDPEK